MADPVVGREVDHNPVGVGEEAALLALVAVLHEPTLDGESQRGLAPVEGGTHSPAPAVVEGSRERAGCHCVGYVEPA